MDKDKVKKSYHEIRLASKWGNYTSDTNLMIKNYDMETHHSDLVRLR